MKAKIHAPAIWIAVLGRTKTAAREKGQGTRNAKNKTKKNAADGSLGLVTRRARRHEALRREDGTQHRATRRVIRECPTRFMARR